ncbi:MAG TPA: cell shape determination protein CcmA [Bacteroidales bacterium]|nr:cell shape determination protein CcmA [Bacteroidales bacterium]
MAKVNETENSTINLISNGTEITGDIKSEGDIRIDGALVGNLSTKGKVVIGNTGKVKGEVLCKNSEVSGEVDGKINVSQLLTLKISSRINGDIITDKLSIEPGARFTGNCNMTDDNEQQSRARTTKQPITQKETAKEE